MNKAIRAAAVERAEGNCEACGGWAGEALHCDHVFGRGRPEQLETVWMLCPPCDEAKTQNRESAAWWLRRFIEHQTKHGYGTAAANLKLLWVEARKALDESRKRA